MGPGGVPPPSAALTPDRPTTVEVVHDSAHTRITRLFLPDGSVIRKEPLGPGRDRRLQHERSILQRLAGAPGVAQLAPVPAWSGSLMLVDVHGLPLATLPTPLDPVHLRRLALALARALAAVHDRGVVHRDLSPTNILLTDDGPQLIDFAFATMATDLRPAFTHHNEVVGTLPYLAPEQTGRAGRPVDHRADLYALGAILYELATGSPPFGHGDPLRLIHDHLTQVPVPPAKVNPAVGSWLSSIVMHLLEKEPDNRYQTVEGLLFDLARETGAGPGPTPARAGAHDLPVRLRPPARPVGREREIATLRSAFANALAGRHRAVIISGAPGVGKTSLINELRSIATAQNGWLLAGSFDQFRRDQEFDAVWQAFHSLGRMLLAEPEARLAGVRQRLREALGPDAAMLAQIHPEFARILRVAPESTDGDPSTRSARLRRVGVETLRAVAATGRPVVLAIDDLQWASPSQLSHLDELLAEETLDGVLVVASYRDTDVDPGGGLAAMLSRWREAQAAVHELALGNLSIDDLTTLLGEMLGLDPERSRQLATVLAGGTGGNPYDTVELVHSLRQDGVLQPAPAGWRWDTEALQRRLDHTDVAELLARRAEALPPPSLWLLRAMACLGGRVELNLLQSATGLMPTEIEERLLPGLADGLLVTEPGPPETVRFRHERVRETILRHADRRCRDALRLALARRLAAHTDEFAVSAEQYLTVLDEVQGPSERARVVALLRRAAEQARLLTNYRAEKRYLTAAVALADPADPSTLIELWTRLHAALYHLGRLDEADQVFADLDQLCGDPLERTDATLVQVSSLTNRNRPQEAVRLGLELLERLDRPAPDGAHLAAEVDRELDALYRWLDDNDDADDRARDEVACPVMATVGALINRLVPPAYLCDHTMMAWLALRAWRIWQRSGPGRTLVGPVCHLTYVIISRRRDHRTGYRVMRRVLATSEAYGYEPETSHARFLHALAAWRMEPLEDCVRLGRLAREGLVKGGDLQNAAFTYYVTTVGVADCEPLEHYLAELESGLDFARRTGCEQAVEVLGVCRRMVATLRGEDPQESVRDLTPEQYATNAPAVAGLLVARALAAQVLGDREELATQTEAMMPLLPALGGTYLTAVAHVLRALSLADQARTGAPERRDDVMAELDRAVAWVAARCTDSPANLLHLLRLLEAERAWAADDFRAATRAFDAAMRESSVRQRPWHLALILEQAARFCLAHGMEHSGGTLLADARRAYQAWGAAAKVDQLDWAFPRLPAPSVPPGPPPEAQAAGRSRLLPGTVDLFSILSASRALSSETSIDGLRSRVVDVLRTMTGATGVHLLLWSDDQDAWLLTVPGEGEAAMLPVEEAGDQRLMPVSVVRYVERTGDPLLVADATDDERFHRDPYLAGLACCSLLTVPIRNRGAVQALLVLENRLIRSAFTAERLDAVVLIAGQLAVSLNNTMVYASLERMVAERTEELAHANERLERLSVTDALSGLANRRRLEEVLDGEWRRAKRSGTPVAIAMVDIDHFKTYNDHFGHVAGDRCLQRVAALLQREIREVDLVARYGGEEFAVVMPGTDLTSAMAVAERLREAVAALAEPHPLVAEGVVTVSVGVAATIPAEARPVGHLAELADAELYRAKRGGRNRVEPSRADGQ